ncbi:hypothetical protein [Wenzhouxiangella sp. EGI_FJ10305]|uniref:hypothetical protein n=1 Tax=Wenzhouxiangella sp. EGI_FJ10305 TaxID=3243768 RepID=UPI0035D92508
MTGTKNQNLINAKTQSSKERKEEQNQKPITTEDTEKKPGTYQTDFLVAVSVFSVPSVVLYFLFFALFAASRLCVLKVLIIPANAR